MNQTSELGGKKLEIVRLAFERFYEDGFHATSMEAALNGSGVSKRTLYKYFPNKESLIEAVLEMYASVVVQELFGTVEDIEDPHEQLIEVFDVKRNDADVFTKGCLGMKAAQEFVGKHDDIVKLGLEASSRGEQKFLELCTRADLPEPARLAAQLNVILQGAFALSHARGDATPFAAAKDAAEAVLESATAASPARR
jgi:AcrR family transcriptional regulator